MTKEIKINNYIIGDKQPCFIIAEAGINHNGQLHLAKKLVDLAVEAGAQAVKFQMRNLKEMYTKDLLKNPNLGEQSFQYMLPLLAEFELSLDDYKILHKYCQKKDILFCATPFDKKSAKILNQYFDLPFFKIGSCDMVNFDLLEQVAKFKKPMIVSTGMSTMQEIEKTVNFFKKLKTEFALMHCNSTYPAPFDQINLKFIQTLKQKFQVPIGYSGHELGIAVSTAAVVSGANILERHITLDRTMKGPDHSASLEPAGIQKLVRDIRNIEKAQGNGIKFLSRGEVLNREVLGKSIVATKDIARGSIIKREMLAVKGPGKGLSPQYLFDLIGIKTKRDFKKDELFQDYDLKSWTSPHPYLDFQTKWGLKARFNNIDELLKYKPKLLEFHFTDQDLKIKFNPKNQEVLKEIEYAVHAPEYKFRDILNLASLDEDEREIAVKATQKAIDQTVKMNKYFKNSQPKFIVHPGGMSLESIKKQDKKQILENFKKSFQALNLQGIEFLPENLPPRPWYFGGQWTQDVFADLDDLVEVCQSLNLKMCLDLSHAKLFYNLSGQDFWQALDKIKPFVSHIHIADAYGQDGEGVQIGEGEIDFKKFGQWMSKLKDVSWIPEIWRGHQRAGEGFLIALERLGKYIK